ncbi:hypothetical protein EON65_13750 [archaeon]|nr:MAG: hypothetical protein EON65_13750 [archaeon]
MRAFGVHTKHIFLGQGCCHLQTSFLASNLHYYGIRKILSQSPGGDGFISSSDNMDGAFLHAKCDAYLPATALMKVTLTPDRKAGHEDVLSVSLAALEEVKQELEKRVETVKALHSYRIQSGFHVYNKLTNQANDFEQDQIGFLGTGCAIPSKYRNVSGILYFIASTRTGILMDVGEGTWFQLLNLRSNFNGLGNLYEFPVDVRKQKWAELIKAAWISHAHADHHLGLITVILERKKYLQLGGLAFTPMLIVAPSPVLLFLADMRDHVYPELQGAYVAVANHVYNPIQYCHACVLERADSLGSTVSHVDQLAVNEEQQAKRQRVSPVVEQAESPENLAYARNCLQQMGIVNIQAVPVIHCPQAYGLVMTRHSAGVDVKIVYSGDTRPCDELVVYGKGAKLLIHEATFQEVEAEEAVQKRHTTIAEAMEVSKRMGAEHLILTHFSQRYHGVPDQMMQEPYSTQDAIVACDYMCLSIKDLSWAPVLTPALHNLIPSSDDLQVLKG